MISHRSNSLRWLLSSSAASVALACLPAHAAVLFFSNGSDISGFVGRDGTRPDGGTVETTTPFLVNGNSQGSYFAATEYPVINFPAISAADTGTQEVWLSFLMGRDSRNQWAGGVLLANGTAPTLPGTPTVFDAAGMVGWHSNAGALTLRDGNENTAGVQTAQPLNTAGQTVAVLARFYENGTDGVFNRGEVYYDANLTDGITFDITGGTNLDLSAGANATINMLRLNADGNAETRYYDNIVVATSRPESVALVPETSSAILGAIGSLLLFRRRRGA